ncbi:hypothetical protein Rsub_03236 [Raphidocelis subcapitata]|uniref:Uncharacterized protein n=1 Tax=Raphidocelis subcapitata TaxID=307507 RepID=A0A2V0NSQ5_9CHLO|nr:hypothetical protein Rsub_03236 [Raphidocelis subcapitata]|eukprot:GBF90664.1 hypothetical protein Rsub_03236 [Raphidocelis subcapitata]
MLRQGARCLTALLNKSGDLPGAAAGWIAHPPGAVGGGCAAAAPDPPHTLLLRLQQTPRASGSSGGKRSNRQQQQQQQQPQQQQRQRQRQVDTQSAASAVRSISRVMAAAPGRHAGIKDGPGSVDASAGSSSSSSSGSGGSGGGSSGSKGTGGWGLLGTPDAARRRIRLYTLTVLFVAVPILAWVALTRATLLSSAHLLMSSHAELQATGARRIRFVLWTDGAAAAAAELHIDELLMGLIKPETPEAAVAAALEALEALAEHASGRAALLADGLPGLLARALEEGWLAGRAVGRARALRDALDPAGAVAPWRRQRDAGAGA